MIFDFILIIFDFISLLLIKDSIEIHLFYIESTPFGVLTIKVCTTFGYE